MNVASIIGDRQIRLTPKVKALTSIATIASIPVSLAIWAQPTMAQIVNDAVASGTPDAGTLTPAMAAETVGLAIPVVADNDSATSAAGSAGVPVILNVFDNDTLDGVPATPANTVITLAPGETVPSQLTFDPATGAVGIAPDTPAGTYEFQYELCETANANNCRIATVSVTVEAPEIEAVEDAITGVIGAIGIDDAINAFDNDILSGQPVDPDAITATISQPAEPLVPGALVPVLDPETGLVDVPAGTPAGTYTIEYEICETLNQSNCAETSITIEVLPSDIGAENDAPEPVRSGIGGDDLINALGNDTLNGVAVDIDDITVSILTPPADPGVVLDPATGLVSVGPNVPAGTYTIEYEICEALNPDNCAVASITIVVEAAVSSLEGTVFLDLDSNRELSEADEPRSGWTVEVLLDGEVIATAITDVNGFYRFDDLLSGPGYSVQFRNPGNNVVFGRIEDVELADNTVVLDQNMPIDPSGVVYDSVSRDPVSGAAVRLLGPSGMELPEICYLDPSQQSQITSATGEYRFDIVPGASSQCPSAETDYTISITPPSGFSFVSTVLLPEDEALDPTGLGAPVLISTSPTAPLEADPTYFLSFELEAGDPDVIYNHIPLDPFLSRDPLMVIKTSTERDVSTGDLVPYEITIRNNENVQRAGATVVDVLPAGFTFIVGSASVDGVAQEPIATNSNRQLEWRNQTIPAGGSISYNLVVSVGAGVTTGTRVNTAFALDGATNTSISNRATAAVRIVPSAVFDCSELLGKVFEDTNRNGYQDEGEPGVPGVRLATVNGLLVTTDEFGRYHIACAAVPDSRIGSNFVLKVDDRTLPLGWTSTTGNPRSIRLTRGKFGELNFGVAPVEENEANARDGNQGGEE